LTDIESHRVSAWRSQRKQIVSLQSTVWPLRMITAISSMQISPLAVLLCAWMFTFVGDAPVHAVLKNNIPDVVPLRLAGTVEVGMQGLVVIPWIVPLGVTFGAIGSTLYCSDCTAAPPAFDIVNE
jgi:hypothetical protein